jgi:sorting nexin-25
MRREAIRASNLHDSFVAHRSEGEDPVFILSAHLMSPVAELEYLRKISELYILFLLPRSYSLSPMKFLLREILTCKSKLL